MDTNNYESKLDALIKKMSEGFFVYNLYDMQKLCIDLGRKHKENNIIYYSLAGIFYDIAIDWDDRELLRSEVVEMENLLKSDIECLLDKIKNKSEIIIQVEQMETVIDKHINRKLKPLKQ